MPSPATDPTTELLADLDDATESCTDCDGTGEIEYTRSGHALDPDTYMRPCPMCSPHREIDRDDAGQIGGARADTVYNDPEGGPIIRRVQAAFDAMAKARNRVARCSRADSLEQANADYRRCEAEYREAADARNRFVEIFRARQMQRTETGGAM